MAACRQADAGKEGAQEVVTVARQDALGVELDTLDVERAMPHPHHDTIGAAGRDEQVVGNAVGGQGQRVVARRCQR